MSRVASNITGQRFGRLIAVKRTGTAVNKSPIWLFKCDCGGETTTRIDVVRGGTCQSCGCFNKEQSTKANARHGYSRSELPEYHVWTGMRRRCNDENDKDYKYYGARGIKIDPRWDNFSVFLSDMGLRPSPEHSIDKIDNDGDYTPSNCRWATKSQQIRNRRAPWGFDEEEKKRAELLATL